MLWGQQIIIYTDHQNPVCDALGMISNCIYCWRLLIEEYAPEIIFIKGIHNTVADAISNLVSKPVVNPHKSIKAMNASGKPGHFANSAFRYSDCKTITRSENTISKVT